MGIRAVFFDMGGTIERFWYTPEDRLRAIPGLNKLFLSVGVELGLSQEKLYELISSGYRRYHKWSIDTMEELPPQRVWSEFILAGNPVDADKLAVVAEGLIYYLESHFYQREMRPEVPAVLESVKKLGLKMGLISNVCSRDLVPDNLKKYGIIHYFDPIVLSSSYGRRKPDPAIFHYAARLADVPTGECLYIGDRIARDIVGARRAGFKLAVQIINEFDHGEDDTGAEPDAIISKMTELLDIIRTELAAPRPLVGDSKQVRALLFDAGDILYYRPRQGRSLHKFLEELDLTDKEIPTAALNALKRQAYHGEITQSQHREALLRLYGLTDPELIERGKQLMEMDENNIHFFKGVPETLKKLKEKGFMLGIVTDTANPIHVKLNWFERGGFGHVWDSIISSKEMGIQKPHPKIYHIALQQLGVTVEQAAFVGHSPEELEGARAIGMKTIAFNYGESARADFYIDKFAELLKVPLLCANGKK
jgi:putative hydrolase of the HAD superfamily